MANLREIFLDCKHSHLSPKRPLWSYNKVHFLISPLIRNARFQLKKINFTNPLYCNIGCGWNTFPNFVNIDYLWRPGIDLCWDITKGLPFNNESVEGVFTEHCLEHLSLEKCKKALKEFHRILKKRKILRIVVPDGELYARLYIQSRTERNICFPAPEPNFKTSMFYLNRAFREFGHKFTYDAETLSLFLQEAGFSNIQRQSFMRGQDSQLLIDQERKKDESLYMEASA